MKSDLTQIIEEAEKFQGDLSLFCEQKPEATKQRFDLDSVQTAVDLAVETLRSMEAEANGATSPVCLDPSPIHNWFELTYAQYLTIPRSVLQSMPIEWQQRFVECLEQLDEAIDWRPKNGCYQVRLMDEVEEWDEDEGRSVEGWGKELDDPLADYQRGRRRIPLRGDRND